MTTKRFLQSHSVWLFGLGYMGFYIPYSALAKALSSGVVPGIDEPVSGFQMLPATALGALIGMPIFLLCTGLWRDAGRLRIHRRLSIPWPGRWTALSAIATAVIIGATTMNYTFAGVSIVFVLLMMRGGVLILSPLVDWFRHRPVSAYSWSALTLSLIAVAVSLADVTSYDLTWLAILNLGAYLGGYVARFLLMSRHAKSGHAAVDRRFFVEEHMTATPALVMLLGVLALTLPGSMGADLRYGFTGFLTTPAVIPALLIGLFYESLFIFGSLIYLSPREYTFCVPINRASSLIAGVIAAFALSVLADLPAPQPSTLISVVIMLAAMGILAFGPRLRTWLSARRARHARPLKLVFVCAENTARSPLAETLCKQEIADRLGVTPAMLPRLGIVIHSAGLTPHSNHPLTIDAAAALRQVGVTPPEHSSNALTPAMIEAADAVFCMTTGQRQRAAAIAPEHAAKVHCLDPAMDIPNPKSGGPAAYLECIRNLRHSFTRRLPELGIA